MHVNPYFSDYLYDANGDISFQGYGYKSIRQFLADTKDIIDKQLQWRQLSDIRPSFRDACCSTAVVETVNKALKTPKKWLDIDVSF